MNRGIARRKIFERPSDFRYFMSRMAYAVRRGEIEVHSFCLMATHFHLLVRSPSGMLSEAMRRIQNEYVRYFNRSRKRDGPLLRGRFRSIPVLTLTYRVILVRYIDYNPVSSKQCQFPWEYPYGSATRFAHGRPPKWLSSAWVMRDAPCSSERPIDAYQSAWGRCPSFEEHELVIARVKLNPNVNPNDDLDKLVRAPPKYVRDWMIRKALLADGTRPDMPITPAQTVVQVVEALRGRHAWHYTTKQGQQRFAWDLATTALLRHLSCLSIREIAVRLDMSDGAIARRLRLHRSLMQDTAHAQRFGRVSTICIRESLGERKVRFLS